MISEKQHFPKKDVVSKNGEVSQSFTLQNLMFGNLDGLESLNLTPPGGMQMY